MSAPFTPPHLPTFKSPDELGCWHEAPLPPFELDGVMHRGVRPAQFADRWPKQKAMLARLRAEAAKVEDPYSRGEGQGRVDAERPQWMKDGEALRRLHLEAAERQEADRLAREQAERAAIEAAARERLGREQAAALADEQDITRDA